jgi:hypothetical protein
MNSTTPYGMSYDVTNGLIIKSDMLEISQGKIISKDEHSNSLELHTSGINFLNSNG